MAEPAGLKRNSSGQAIAELIEKFGERVSTSEAVREQHGDVLTWNNGPVADGVVFAETTEEISEIVQICGRYQAPVIPYGTGRVLRWIPAGA